MIRKSDAVRYALFVVCGVAVLLGCIIRLTETINGNYVFGFDHGRDFLAARTIAVDHKLTLIGSEAGAGFAGLPGVFHGPGYHYILALLYVIASGNPYGAIVFLCVLSFMILIFLYRLIRESLGPKGAIVVVLLASISPPLTAQARMIWAPNFSGLLVIPFLYCLWWTRKKSILSVFATTLLAASLYHFELPMAIPALVALILYYALVLRLRDIRFWIAVAGGIIIGFLPMIMFESRHGWGVVKGLVSYGARVSDNSSKAPFYPVKEFVGDGNALFTTIQESFLLYVSWIRAYVPWLLLGSSLFYVVREKKKEVRVFITALLLLIAAHLLVFYPYRGPVYVHYFTLLYFVYPILGGYVAVQAMQNKCAKWVVYGLGLLLFLGAISLYPQMIMKDYKDYGGTAKIRGKIDAINSIYEHAAGAGFNLLIFSPPVYTYPYDYILKWYALKRYGYVPGSIKTGTVYLLIEPDPEKPWSYNGWLETVIKHGEVIASWKLPSGFII